MLNYILFDLDGTLTDSGNGIINSLKYALNKMGIKETDESVLKSFIKRKENTGIWKICKTALKWKTYVLAV